MRYGMYDAQKPRYLRDEWVSMGIGFIVIVAVSYAIANLISHITMGKTISPCPDEGCVMITPTPTVTPWPTVTVLPVKPPTSGKASYYSVDGCIGCNPGRIMANGEKLDDTKFTLAHNQIPLNTMVEVVNTRNGKKATAKVTDRGGFNKYNRVADLSLALARMIELKTDVDVLTITPMR